MLTVDLLNKNATLAALGDDVKKLIAELSANDENAVIAQKTGEIYGALDADILGVSGVEKNGTEKTYSYMKRVLSALKSDKDGLSVKVADLEKTKAKLEKDLQEGAADKATLESLKQAQKDLEAVRKQFNDLNALHTKAEDDHKAELFGVRVDNEIQAALGGLKFRKGLPDSVTKVLAEQVSAKVRGMNPEMIDDGNGGRRIVYKDAQGAILRNPDNQLNPFTSAELVRRELGAMQVLDDGRLGAGGGTGGGTGGNGGSALDIQGARTRVEAYDMISRTLMERGLTIGSAEFDRQMGEAWKANDVAKLPER